MPVFRELISQIGRLFCQVMVPSSVIFFEMCGLQPFDQPFLDPI